ncbi:MAG: Eco57I restriction-modification methylase domain-containing protein, partial [Promethearchaeota archaeon]
MKSEIKKLIEKHLKKYNIKEIRISDKKYQLYVIPELCDEDLNIFEGFLFTEVEKKREASSLLSKYKPPVSGYVPRLSLIFHEGLLLIKDYRKNRHIIKNISKINKLFLKKLKKTLDNPTAENFNKLFDRTDFIEELYILYEKTREYLLKNISGIPEEEKREEFIDNFMMQMLTLWYLQERGFFNNDKNYFITKFKELKQKKLFNGFKNYYEFLIYLFERISGYNNKQYIEDDLKIGKVVVIGPAVFINGNYPKSILIPDKCFYKEGMTEILINIPPKKISQEVPLLNLFESRDWTEGNIDEFVLGAIYEKLITYMERKKTGAYYTPEEITFYICENTIKPFLIDRINEKFNHKFKSIEHIIESNDRDIILYLFKQLKEIKILDPAVGSAHFLESAINVLLDIYEKIWYKTRKLGIKKDFEIIVADECGKIKSINLFEISDEDQFKMFIKFFIILSKNIYGVDINPSALKVAKARLFLTLAKHFNIHRNYFIRFPNVHFNLRGGNSLIGYVELNKEKEKISRQTVLNLFVKENTSTHLIKTIKLISKLEEYLKETAKSLNMSGDVGKDIEKLNEILSKKEIKWYDFQHVLKTKEKLIRILIASLNSQYARPLNKLINQITELFNIKLDEKFAKDYQIDLVKIRQIKTFHWIFEFPEVFLEKKGFDVIVGNPPYVDYRRINSIERDFFKSHFESTKVREKYNYYITFTERSIQLNNYKGNFCFIMPQKWLSSNMGLKLRQFILKRFSFYEIVDLLHTTEPVFKGQSFANVGLYFISNQINSENNIIVKYGVEDAR